MKNRLKLSLIILSLLSLQVTAQEKKTLGLNEAIDLGIQKHRLRTCDLITPILT